MDDNTMQLKSINLDDNSMEVEDVTENIGDAKSKTRSIDGLIKTKEYKSESFTKTFKTLIDITVQPLPDEDENHEDIKSLSSNDDVSDDDINIYSIIPSISHVSRKFITESSKLFSRDESANDVEQGDNAGKKWDFNLNKWF